MNIVFMGTPDFAVPSLNILQRNGYGISAVVTAPDKPRGRGQQVSSTPVKEFAVQHSLPLLQPASLTDASFVNAIATLSPDLIVVVAFRILPPEVFTLAAKGAFNLHASLLPKYRGAAPINWAIIKGEKESGVTTFFLREKVDTGNIILQARVAIPATMTAGELTASLSEVGAEIVLQTVRLIETGKAHPRPQDDAQSSPAPKIFKSDCRIDWKRNAADVQNFIRGLSPYPTAWTMHNGTMLKVFRSEKLDSVAQGPSSEGKNQEAGRVSVADGKLMISVSDGQIAVFEVQQEGRRKMGIDEFLRGYKIRQGDRFG